MFDFKKSSGKNEVVSNENKPKHDLVVREVEDLTQRANEHRPVEKVLEKGRLGVHKVTGRELNAAATQIDDSIIQLKNVQIQTLRHIIRLYQLVDSLDEEHIAGILTAIQAAETATDWARINDENIGKITAYLMKDERVIAREKELENKISTLESKVKKALYVAIGAVVVAAISITICLLRF